VRDIEILTRSIETDPGLGVVLIAVPRSLLAPHAVYRAHDKRRRMFWPVRSGTDTRYLDETELAEFYRTRFIGAAAQADRLITVQSEARRRHAAAPVWLRVALVPGLPGAVRPSDRQARARALVHGWAARQPASELVPRLFGAAANVTVGVRRAVISSGSSWRSERIHGELHDDGAGTAAIALDQPSGLSGGQSTAVRISRRSLALDCFWLTSLLVEHALEAGAAGEAQLVTELDFAAIPRHVGVEIMEDDGWDDRVPGSHVIVPEQLSTNGRVTGPALTVDLSSLAGGVRAVVRVAAVLGGDLAAVFGVADLQILTPDGQLRAAPPGTRLTRGGQDAALYAWAAENDLLAADPHP
jgi:hypothetical protein